MDSNNIMYQAKSFMLYNAQITYWNFVSNIRTHEQGVIALHNSK